MSAAMNDTEVERVLGYTPCVCGVLNGTWHNECFRNKTKAQIAAGYKRAFIVARRHLAAIDAASQPMGNGGEHG